MCNKMSDVRLSNASPTLERVDARQPESARPSVRRNLFGSPDREEIRRYFAESMQEGVQDFREEYNFDPVDERPLTPRNYDWQEDRDAPEFYHRAPHGSQRPQREGDSSGETSSEQPADRESSRKRRSGPCSSECQTKRSHTEEGDDDDDDDEEQSGGAHSQAVKVAEEDEGANRLEVQ